MVQLDNKFLSIMSERTDEELINILFVCRNDYQPEAIEAAEYEFHKRNISLDTIEAVKKELCNVKDKKAAKANMSLQTYWKVLAFLFPGIMNLFFALIFTAEGYEKRTRDMWRWTIYGILFYLLMLMIIRFF